MLPFCLSWFLIFHMVWQVSAKKVLQFFEKVMHNACFHAYFLPPSMCHVHSTMLHEGPYHSDRPLSPPVAVQRTRADKIPGLGDCPPEDLKIGEEWGPQVLNMRLFFFF